MTTVINKLSPRKFGVHYTSSRNAAENSINSCRRYWSPSYRDGEPLIVTLETLGRIDAALQGIAWVIASGRCSAAAEKAFKDLSGFEYAKFICLCVATCSTQAEVKDLFRATFEPSEPIEYQAEPGLSSTVIDPRDADPLIIKAVTKVTQYLTTTRRFSGKEPIKLAEISLTRGGADDVEPGRYGWRAELEVGEETKAFFLGDTVQAALVYLQYDFNIDLRAYLDEMENPPAPETPSPDVFTAIDEMIIARVANISKIQYHHCDYGRTGEVNPDTYGWRALMIISGQNNWFFLGETFEEAKAHVASFAFNRDLIARSRGIRRVTMAHEVVKWQTNNEQAQAEAAIVAMGAREYQLYTPVTSREEFEAQLKLNSNIREVEGKYFVEQTPRIDEFTPYGKKKVFDLLVIRKGQDGVSMIGCFETPSGNIYAGDMRGNLNLAEVREVLEPYGYEVALGFEVIRK